MKKIIRADSLSCFSCIYSLASFSAICCYIAKKKVTQPLVVCTRMESAHVLSAHLQVMNDVIRYSISFLPRNTYLSSAKQYMNISVHHEVMNLFMMYGDKYKNRSAVSKGTTLLKTHK